MPIPPIPSVPSVGAGLEYERIPRPVYAAPSGGDPGVARRAAIWLALTLPFLGLPIGWVFMMIEDERKQAIGKVCVLWSVIALVFHMLFMMVAVEMMSSTLVNLLAMRMMPNARSAPSLGGGLGNGLGGLGGGTDSGTHGE
jgi:hypothetical protein